MTETKLQKFIRKFRERRYFRRSSVEEVFTYIYKTNRWHDEESRSGTGSNLSQTENLRERLPALCEELEIETLLDIPCGDFYWMKMIDLPVRHYLGADIVAEMIEDNRQKFASDSISFQTLNLIADPLPQYDAILCRDCFVHLDYRSIDAAVRNIINSGAKYLMTTSHSRHEHNSDQLTGKHRLLNLERAPFDWPPPIHVIEDGWNNDRVRQMGKVLGVWEVSAIRPLDLPGQEPAGAVSP